MNKQNNTYSGVISAMIIAVTVVLFALSLMVEFRDDDLYFRQQLQQESVAGFMVDQYYTWDGRFISFNAPLQLLMLKYTTAPFAVFVWTCMLLLSVFFMYRILRREAPSKGEWKKVLLLFLLIWISYSAHLRETLYWATGGVYMMSLALIFGFLWMMHSRHTHGWWRLAGAVTALAVGLSGVTGALPVLVLLGIHFITVKPKSGPTGVLIAWGVMLLAGIIINVAAPGNYIRASVLESSFQWDISDMAINLAKITWRYLVVALPAIAGAVVARIIIHGRAWKNTGLLAGYTTPLEMLHRLRWWLAAFSTIMPMLMIPDFAGGRTAVYFVALVFMGIIEGKQNGTMIHGRRYNKQ